MSAALLAPEAPAEDRQDLGGCARTGLAGVAPGMDEPDDEAEELLRFRYREVRARLEMEEMFAAGLPWA